MIPCGAQLVGPCLQINAFLSEQETSSSFPLTNAMHRFSSESSGFSLFHGNNNSFLFITSPFKNAGWYSLFPWFLNNKCSFRSYHWLIWILKIKETVIEQKQFDLCIYKNHQHFFNSNIEVSSQVGFCNHITQVEGLNCCHTRSQMNIGSSRVDFLAHFFSIKPIFFVNREEITIIFVTNPSLFTISLRNFVRCNWNGFKWRQMYD